MKKEKDISTLSIHQYSGYDIGKPIDGYAKILRFVFVAILSLSTVLMFDSFITTDCINTTIFGCLSLIYTLIFSLIKEKNRILKAISIILVAFIIVYFALNYEIVFDGFINIVNRYLFVTIEDTGFNAGFSDYNQSVQYAYAVSLLLINFGLTSSLYYTSSFKGTFIFTFPFFELGAYWGLAPNYVTFFIMIFSWVVSLYMANTYHTKVKNHKTAPYSFNNKTSSFEISSIKLKYNNSSCAFKYAMIICVVTAVLTLITSTFFNERPESIDEARVRIKTAFENFSVEEIPQYIENITDSFKNTTKKTGATNSGKLGQSDKITFKYKTVLEVTVKPQGKQYFDSPLYLKGFVASNYEGDRWVEIDAEKYTGEEFFKATHTDRLNYQDFNSYYFVSNTGSETANDSYFNITIKNKDASTKYLYTPYYADYNSINFKESYYDFYLIPKEKEYSYNFYGGLSSDSALKKYADLTEYRFGEYGSYEIFARKNYTDFDFKLIEKAYNDIFSDYGYGYMTSPSVNLGVDFLQEESLTKARFAANLIQEYFNKNFTYSLEVGKTPEGEDFVQYFLEEQKSGSCTYFASAGVLLMRAMGFPARYVEGFVVDRSEFKSQSDGSYQAKVKDSDAHAWCEVFIDYIGWVPVEFTVGYQYGENPNHYTTTATTTTTTTTTTTVTTTTSMAQQSTISSATTNITSEITTPLFTTSTLQSSGSKTNYGKIIEIAIRIALKIILILGVLLIWKVLYMTHRKKVYESFNGASRSLCIKAMYKEFCKILKIAGISLENSKTDIQSIDGLYEKFSEAGLIVNKGELSLFVELAVESDMSKNEIDEENYIFAKEFCEALSKGIYGTLSSFKKFYAKYIKFLF